MILQDNLKVKVGSKQIKYYSSLGYKVSMGDEILIKNEEALPGCRVIEERKCDLCGKHYQKTHASHVTSFNRFNKDVCPSCVKSSEEIKRITKQRRENSLIEHYGVNNPSKSEEIKKKKEDTCLKNFGTKNPMQSEENKNKAKNTNLLKYGNEFPSKTQEVKQKSIKTCIEKYGVEYTSQVKETREKAALSYYIHNSQKVSKPQFNIYTLLKEKGYNVELNYPVSTLSLDILLILGETKIDIEYDGSFYHQDASKDRRRDEFVKSKGYKVLRIKEDKKIPELSIIEEYIFNLVNSNKKFLVLDTKK